MNNDFNSDWNEFRDYIIHLVNTNDNKLIIAVDANK